MFMPIKFNTTVQLQPKELTNKYEDIILNKLKSNLENVCSKHGYIKKNSIKIVKRSAGYFKEQHFNGNIAFDLNCIAEICNPAQDSVIKCKVKAKNNLGLLAEGIYEDTSILEVIIPKISSGIQSEINIDNVNIGDEVKVQVCGKKFTLYDSKISIVGKVIKDKDENIVVIQENEDEDKIVDDDLEVDDILTDAVYISNDEDEEEDDDDNVKKLDIIETNEGKIGGELGADLGTEIEEDEDDDDNDDDFSEEDFEEDFEEEDFDYTLEDTADAYEE
jgi:DNA-directed RNA polymerase subunit E'/Rpb7